ncbi:hypothetical protein Tco_0938206 [Tanacetum coccineum]|uniref:Uncharacterized protein n=1 Tax=Tanacetum coccineum TaxID=301880 RepID=A0ABQ5DJ73_9ASTR
MWYALRSPPVSIRGLYGKYLNKISAARATKQKDSGEFHPGLRGRHKGREAALIDRVHDLEGLCESLLTLPKEVKSLRGRIFKLESIIQIILYQKLLVITLKTNRVEKEERHVPGVFMPANPVSQPIYGDFSSDLAVLNGFCNLSQNEDEKGDCEHYKYTYSSKQEDQIIRLADQRQQDDISKMVEEAEQKIEFEIQRLYDHREARLNKIAEEEKQRKFIGHMNSSAHMKLAIDRCVPKKRKYVDVMRSPYSGLSETLNVPSMEQLANQKNVLNPLMIEKCKSETPRTIEELSEFVLESSIWRMWLVGMVCRGLMIIAKGWLVEESGETYDPSVNPNDQQNNYETPINFDSEDDEEESTPQPKSQIPKPFKETLVPKPYKPNIPYPQRLRKEKMEAQYGMPNYGKFLKELVSYKHKLKQISSAFLSDESSTIIQNKVPPKLGDPRSFLIPCTFSKAFSCNALADLGASINLMPYSLYA